MRQYRAHHFVSFFFVVALYIGIRVWGLGDSCLWFDEVFSVHAAQHGWSAMFSFVALDLIHPPLFYALLKVWITIGGEGVMWLRALPVLFAVIAIVPFMLLGRELNIKFWPRVLGLFLLATKGCLIKYSQEVRMYSLLMCLALFSAWLFVKFWNRGVGIVALTVVNLLLVYTHYFGWLVVAAEIAAVVIYKRGTLRQIAVMAAVVFAGFLPWAFVVWNAAADGSSLGQNIGWMTRPTARGLFEFLLDLVEPFYYQASSIDAASNYVVSIPLLLIFAVPIVVFVARSSSERDRAKDSVRLLNVFIAVPVLLAFIASFLLPYSIWGTRHLIIAFPFVAMLIGVAVTSVQISWIRTAAVTLLLLFTGFAGFKFAVTPQPVYSWCNWESQTVHAIETSPAKIYAVEDLAAYHVWFALQQHGMAYASVAKIADIPGIAEDKAYFLPRGFDGVKTVNFVDVHENKFLLAYRGKSIDPNVQPLKTFIDAGYKVTAQSVLDAANEQTFFLLLERGS